MHAHRLNAYRLAPDGINALRQVEAYLRETTLGTTLIEMVKMRASQINGCAFCLDMHAREARELGETQDRLDCLAGWRDFPGFSEKERVALAWAEAVTRVAETHAPDNLYEDLRGHFTDEEIVALTVSIAVINTWNRMQIAMRRSPGTV